MRFGYALATFVCCLAPQVCPGDGSAMVKAKRLLEESGVAIPRSQHHALRGRSKEKTVNRLRASLLARKADIDLSSGPDDVKEGHVNTGDEEQDIMPLGAVAPLNPSRKDADMERVLSSTPTCASGYVDCCAGSVCGSLPPKSCEDACGGNCCVGAAPPVPCIIFDITGTIDCPEEPCNEFTGKVCKDDSCSGFRACRYANIPHVVNSCKDGANACSGAGFSGSVGDITDSCHGENSCREAGSGGTVGNIDFSCRGEWACHWIGRTGGIGDITGSCNADHACVRMAYDNHIDADVNNCCNTDSKCGDVQTIGQLEQRGCPITTNSPPVVEALGAMVVFVTEAAGAPADNGHMSVSAIDPDEGDTDTLTYAWDVHTCPGTFDPQDDTTPDATLAISRAEAANVPNGLCQVTVTVCDAHDACADTEVVDITILDNHAPTVEPLDAMVVFVTDAAGAPANNGLLSVSASDPDEGDTLTYAWLIVNEECLISSITLVDEDTATPTLTADAGTQPQVCEVKVAVCDNHDACAEDEHGIVVIVDPDAGFVTGGGFIQSPLGAYTANSLLTGKANFGFVSRYKKGHSTPSGNTNFVFTAASLHFKSTSYDWLVITGSDKARFKGTGLIEGNSEEHGFMLTACDNGEGKEDPPDTFRIKIWKLSDDTVIYDNMLGEDDDSCENLTPISGGNIQIHQK